MYVSFVEGDDLILEDDGPNPRKRRKGLVTPWSKDDIKELKKLFVDNLRKETCPKRKEVLDAMAQSRMDGGNIHTRSWENIKKKVYYLVKKKQ